MTLEMDQPPLKLDRAKIEANAMRLFKWYPEVVPVLADPVCQQCGWDEEDHAEMGEESPDHGFDPGPPAGVPFFSEAFLYDLLGKEDARSVLALVNNLIRSIGLNPHELEDRAEQISEEELDNLLR